MSRRARFSVAGVLAIAFALWGTGSAQAATTYGPGGVNGASILMSPTSITVHRTSVVTIKVTIDTKVYSSYGYQFMMGFDSTKLGCATITNTGKAFPQTVAKQCDGSHANFAAGATLGTAPFHGKAVVATVTFKPTGKLGYVTLKFVPTTGVADAATSTD